MNRVTKMAKPEGGGGLGGTGILSLSPAHPADGLGLLQPCSFPFADKVRMLLQYRLNVSLEILLEPLEHLLKVVLLGHSYPLPSLPQYRPTAVAANPPSDLVLD